ncbi:MAG: hypothetical protein EAZ42_10950 [Verrucomicrobia bacterium]|nr:MAG: hypothetical protein EAZ42_10950 [Verrucomicrobiota bacterium]
MSRRPSIRRWLLLRSGLAITLLHIALGFSIFYIVKQRMFEALDQSIGQTAALLGDQVELEHDLITFEWQEGLGTNRALFSGGLFQYWDEQTGMTTRSPALAAQDLPKFVDDSVIINVRNIHLPDGQRGRAVGIRIHPFVIPREVERLEKLGRIIDPKSRSFILVVAGNAEPIYHTLDQLRWVLFTFLGGSLAVFIIITARVTQLALRPIEQLSNQIENRSESQASKALDIPAVLPAELLKLAENFNRLLLKVSTVRERESDFIRMVAHELRTPIAGLRATTELALSKPRDAFEYEEKLTICHRAATDMHVLITRLLALAKLSEDGQKIPLQKIDLANCWNDCMGPFQARFAERKIAFECAKFTAPIEVQGDLMLCRLIFNNLLENALVYSNADGKTKFIHKMDAAAILLRITNSTNLPLHDVDRWFEPLFRADASRHQSEQHLGIGLTLSLNAANAMGWRLSASIVADDEVSLELRIPLS